MRDGVFFSLWLCALSKVVREMNGEKNRTKKSKCQIKCGTFEAMRVNKLMCQKMRLKIHSALARAAHIIGDDISTYGCNWDRFWSKWLLRVCLRSSHDVVFSHKFSIKFEMIYSRAAYFGRLYRIISRIAFEQTWIPICIVIAI